MKRLLAVLAIMATAAYGATNTYPENTALMINYTNLNIVFPTGTIGLAQWKQTNDIASASVYAAGSNALHSVDTGLQAQVTANALNVSNTFSTLTQYSSVSGRVTILEGQTNGYASSNQYSSVSGRVAAIEGLTSGWSSAYGYTNTVGDRSYTNTGFILKSGSNVTLRASGSTNFIDAARPLQRYTACADSDYEILVMATGTGITATVVGSSITVTIPSGVNLVSARIRWPGTVSTTFTINLGTTDMPNSSFATRWGACFWACREDTGAYLPTATCKLDSSNHDQLIVAGLNDVSVNHCMLSF